MTVPGRSRLIKAADADAATPLRASTPSTSPNRDASPMGVWRKRSILEATARATEIVGDAEQTAAAILASAQRDAQRIGESARAEAETRARSEWTLAFDAIRSNVLLGDEAQERRVVALAKLLAERLVGAELHVHPEAIGTLAAEVLRESRGATRFVLCAHPSQIARLAGLLGEAFPDLTLRAEPAFGVADIRLDTDVGSVDGSTRTQLDRLGTLLERSQRARRTPVPSGGSR